LYSWHCDYRLSGQKPLAMIGYSIDNCFLYLGTGLQLHPFRLEDDDGITSSQFGITQFGFTFVQQPVSVNIKLLIFSYPS
jgi:hypothetical protein